VEQVLIRSLNPHQTGGVRGRVKIKHSLARPRGKSQGGEVRKVQHGYTRRDIIRGWGKQHWGLNKRGRAEREKGTKKP